ncbi:group II intron reverse transcriptase/maturase [Carboxylicivirga linearis]|uniref:RNA-directed DNA polymerase n=1 Tax=Carboxylicivirga linearis TaxID=1628157 RepID=A0ABS5JVE5_9BACT|nr:group II intron reverse transcriptase/maturase [Carboxylicivirga linearis]MBS2098862.1 group II intron reverse transcriptase/maturase [Carboxylicivirga linearis]
MNLWNETKSIPISRQMIWEAYKKVKANKGSEGVDEVSMDEFDANRSKHLYKLWNRMASGSYFPPPVKEVEISKDDGGIRKLGVPTIADRVGQMAVKDYFEPRFEKLFSEHSYGYRPNKSAHQALTDVRENCWKYDWVIDLDIKGFFDNISHEKLMVAVQRHVPEHWACMYIKRWLEMPVQQKDGNLMERQGKGTPQGGVISPLLANLFLHYTFDKWLELKASGVKYVRYADDAIIHCKSQAQAEWVLSQLHQRMNDCGLELHPEKTKLVYCRDYKRKGKYRTVKFDFLGFSFQPRTTKSKRTGKLFLGFDCAISIKSRKKLADKLEELDIINMSFKSIVGIAQKLNPLIRGWINYYGKFRGHELSKVFYLLWCRLVRWARKRYKRYRYSLNKAYAWLDRVRKQYPYLFYHWQLRYSH